MQKLTITLFLEYLYSRFAVTFILCIIGVVIRELLGNINAEKKVRIGEVIASALFSTILMCVVSEYIHIIFSAYVLVCTVAGIWSRKIVQLVTDSNFMGKIATRYIKKIASPVAEALEETLKEENADNKEKPNNDENEKENPDNE